MQLSILSLKGKQFEGEVISVNAKAANGEITVLNHHRPLITRLVPGPLRITPSTGDVFTLETKGGFLEVSPENIVSVLLD